jgi:hydroxymethylpyrimidine/phosphomethylpyrimidine kinase
MRKQNARPVALTIAGSDNSAGAGLQADLKTFSALGVYGLTAATCIVAEVPGRVSAIQPVDPKIVAEQIRISFDAFPVAALKTGLLCSRQIVGTVCDTLDEIFSKIARRPFLVVDPVLVATSGDPLLEPAAIALYKRRLFKLASLVTPNLSEVRELLGRSVSTVKQMREAGAALAGEFGVPFLLKGGHLRGSAATDLLFAGGGISEFSAPAVKGVATHGTGCAYSAAITAGVARGLALEAAVAQAKEFVTAAIKGHLRWKMHGRCVAALDHFAAI